MNFSITKMKKHPIDEMFAQKLQNFEAQPSQRALERFQERLKEEKKTKAVGYWFMHNPANYGIAAGILVVIGIGVWLGFNPQQANQTLATNAPQRSLEKPSKVVTQETTQAFTSVLPKKEEKVIIRTINAANPNIQQENYILENSENEIAQRAFEESQNKLILDESLKDELTIALEKSTQNEQNILNNSVENTDTIFRNDIGETIVIFAENITDEHILLPQIDADSPTQLADAHRIGSEQIEQNQSFITKVVTEFKHFKYGEKVDLSSFGIKRTVAFDNEKTLSKDVLWNRVKTRIRGENQ